MSKRKDSDNCSRIDTPTNDGGRDGHISRGAVRHPFRLCASAPQ